MRSGWNRLGIGLALAGIAGLGWILRTEREPRAPGRRAGPAPLVDSLPPSSLQEGRPEEEGRRPVASSLADGTPPLAAAKQGSAVEAAGALDVRGTVLRATGEPAGDVEVAFLMEGKELGSLRTDEEGKLHGWLTVVRSARQRRDGCPLVARIRVSGHSELRRRFPLLSEEGSFDLGTLMLQRWGRIAGHVVAPGPLPDPESWSVSAFPEDFPGLPRVSTETRTLDAQGGFSLGLVTPGPTEVRLGHPVLGVVLRETIWVQDEATAFLTLSYDGPDPRTTLVVAFPPGQTLGPEQVELRDLAERPVSAARVVGEELWFAGLTRGSCVLRVDFPRGPSQRFFRVWGGQRLLVTPGSSGSDLQELLRQGVVGEGDIGD